MKQSTIINAPDKLTTYTFKVVVEPDEDAWHAHCPALSLFEREVDLLRDAARKRGRYGFRDAVMILVAYRHALRVAELCALRWGSDRA